MTVSDFLAGSKIYAMLDAPEAPKYAMEIRPEHAREYNRQGHGIFRTVNAFNGPRQKQNLTRINAWAVDIDTGDKRTQLARIKSGLVPSMVVETKRGYQVYFAAKNGQQKHWNALVLDRLVPFYGADRNARDVCRILRVPGFYHLKDAKSPFLVRSVYQSRFAYSEKDLAYFYPDKSEPARKEYVAREIRETGGSTDFWENVWRIDSLEFLQRVSGTEAVNGETYSFRKNANGNFNILVDGRGTSCFIDKDYRIGSLSGGGPTVYRWLLWLGHSKRAAVKIIKNYYPEVGNG